MPNYLSPTELHDALTIRDLSDPNSGAHAMQTLLQAVTDTLSRQWDVPGRIIRHSPLVSVVDNYDHLGFSASDVTRDQRYSRYISPTVMLRSHTSASIPSLLRALDPDTSIDELWGYPGSCLPARFHRPYPCRNPAPSGPVACQLAGSPHGRRSSGHDRGPRASCASRCPVACSPGSPPLHRAGLAGRCSDGRGMARTCRVRSHGPAPVQASRSGSRQVVRTGFGHGFGPCPDAAQRHPGHQVAPVHGQAHRTANGEPGTVAASLPNASHPTGHIDRRPRRDG